MRQVVYPCSVWISRGMRRAGGGNPQPESDSPFKSGLAIRAPALSPWLRAYDQGQRQQLDGGVKRLTVYLKEDSVNRLTVRQNIDGQCQDIDGGRKANGRCKAKRKRTYVRTKVQRKSEGQAKVSIR